ncbi:MAG: DHHA1 domain-containing protein [Alistipes finegoldii]
MRREQVAQWADKIIASTPERRGVMLIATQTDRTPEFVKDLAYCLRARAPKLVLVQGSVNDGKPMLTVMLGEEIAAQGVNAGAVVREAAKLMQGGGGGQAFFATAGGKNPDRLQAAIDKAVEPDNGAVALGRPIPAANRLLASCRLMNLRRGGCDFPAAMFGGGFPAAMFSAAVPTRFPVALRRIFAGCGIGGA